MLRLDDLTLAFQKLGLSARPVIVHASLRSFGQVQGGASAVIAAMGLCFPKFIMPAHTYKAMVTPNSGPPHNALDYAKERALARFAEVFRNDMPADVLMGIIPETLRTWTGASRSAHPILSFVGLRADDILKTQTIAVPMAPIRALVEQNGWVVLMGVNHTVNTSIHLGEELAGRRQFTRWALTEDGVTACPGFPGCSAGFQAIEPEVRPFSRSVQVGGATVSAVPLRGLMHKVIEAIKNDPYALLCEDLNCERCSEIVRGLQQ